MRIQGHGISLDPPAGWESRIFRHGDAPPVLHAATMPLSAQDGAYGAAATGRMRPDDVFMALVEFETDGAVRAGEGLYSEHGPPRSLRRRDFSANCLQVTRSGQFGCQRFFTAAGRAFCLYAVIRPAFGDAERLAGDVSRLVATLRIAAR